MSGPDPAVARVRTAVREALLDLSAGELVLVGCSGGADSLALAAATAFVAPRLGLRAGAVVVDHGLAPTSAAVTARAAQQCRDLELDPVLAIRVDVGSGGAGGTGSGGLEGRARDARHGAFDDAVRSTGATAVLLAHTMDDQAETVLLRLARGSGARSLAGMAPRRGVLRRPLLGVRRDQLRRACRAQGLAWWEDPGNAVDGPQTTRDGGALPRSAVRHRALPALAAAVDADPVVALARTADLLRRDADLLEELARDLGARASSSSTSQPSSSPSATLRVAALVGAHPALLPRVLRAWLLDAGAPAGDVGAQHVEAVGALVTAWRGQVGVDVPGGLRVVRRGEVLAVEVLPR